MEQPAKSAEVSQAMSKEDLIRLVSQLYEFYAGIAGDRQRPGLVRQKYSYQAQVLENLLTLAQQIEAGEVTLKDLEWHLKAMPSLF